MQPTAGCGPMSNRVSDFRRFAAAPGAALALVLLVSRSCAVEPAQPLDPAAWGGDHVGKPPVEFMSGDECLFCHRNDVGPTWSSNRHGRTIRTAERDSAALQLMKKSPV